jgi:cysteine-rich repeat protein
MNTRIAISLSLAVFGACATDADTDTATEVAEHQATVVKFEQPLFDQLGKAECGNGLLAVSAVQQVELRWLATTCYGPNELSLEIGGREVLRTEAGAGCTCLPGVRSARLTDADVMNLINGTVEFTVEAPGATLLAWAEITVIDQFGAHDFTIFDQDGENTYGEEANLCTAGSTENGSGTIQVQFGEQCDDGNNVDGDGCSSTCRKE